MEVEETPTFEWSVHRPICWFIGPLVRSLVQWFKPAELQPNISYYQWTTKGLRGSCGFHVQEEISLIQALQPSTATLQQPNTDRSSNRRRHSMDYSPEGIFEGRSVLRRPGTLPANASVRCFFQCLHLPFRSQILRVSGASHHRNATSQSYRKDGLWTRAFCPHISDQYV